MLQTDVRLLIIKRPLVSLSNLPRIWDWKVVLTDCEPEEQSPIGLLITIVPLETKTTLTSLLFSIAIAYSSSRCMRWTTRTCAHRFNDSTRCFD